MGATLDLRGVPRLSFTMLLSFSLCLLLSLLVSPAPLSVPVSKVWSSYKVQPGDIADDVQPQRRLMQAAQPADGYIGYGALTGSYVPCPPGSGYSYYTVDCHSATGPANPYTRGCSTITNCARSPS